jgi:hypothetical protein
MGKVGLGSLNFAERAKVASKDAAGVNASTIAYNQVNLQKISDC